MAFGWAGAGDGASKSLEEIVAQRLLTQKLEAEIANRQKLTEIEGQQLNQRALEHSDNVKARQRDDDRLDAAQRDRNNVTGVRRMVSESLMQGGEPDRKALAAMQIEAGDAPTMLNEPPKRLRSVTTPGPGGRPINRMVGEDEAVEEYREPKQPNAGARVQSQWVRMPDGSVVDINGVAPQGSKPYDAVAERSSQPANPAEAQDTAREAARLAGALLNHKGMPRAFGVFDSMMPTINQNTADAESLRDSLTSLLTLENTGKLKGVLSNTDMQILRQASSSLNPKMGDQAARAELQRIVQVMSRAAGGQTTPDVATSHEGGGDAVDAMIAKYRKKP